MSKPKLTSERRSTSGSKFIQELKEWGKEKTIAFRVSEAQRKSYDTLLKIPNINSIDKKLLRQIVESVVIDTAAEFVPSVNALGDKDKDILEHKEIISELSIDKSTPNDLVAIMNDPNPSQFIKESLIKLSKIN